MCECVCWARSRLVSHSRICCACRFVIWWKWWCEYQLAALAVSCDPANSTSSNKCWKIYRKLYRSFSTAVAAAGTFSGICLCVWLSFLHPPSRSPTLLWVCVCWNLCVRARKRWKWRAKRCLYLSISSECVVSGHCVCTVHAICSLMLAHSNITFSLNSYLFQ